MRGRAGSGTYLLLPGLATYGVLFAAPMALLLAESFRVFTPGRVGVSGGSGLTLQNYAELLHVSFLQLFVETVSISLAATAIGIAVAFPIAYQIAWKLSPRLKVAAMVGLTTFMFLSIIVKTYSLELSFGAVSPLRPVLNMIGISPNGRVYIQALVAAGLLQFIIPISTLTLVGTHQNINRHLVEAAQALGAPTWRAHLAITVPLAVPGILSSSLLAFSFGVSAFVIPMILGKGRVVFLSNLIYTRFSEIANYPSGASISIVTGVVSIVIVYGMSRLIMAARRGHRS